MTARALLGGLATLVEVVLVALAVPVAIILIGAPIALAVRLVLSVARAL